MRVLACGGRDYTNRDFIWGALSAIHRETPITCLIHGGQRGADVIAGEWAEFVEINTMRFPVSKEEWKRLGPSAGPIRNRAMIVEGRPDLVISFPGGRGTANMLSQATKSGIPIRSFSE